MCEILQGGVDTMKQLDASGLADRLKTVMMPSGCIEVIGRAYNNANGYMILQHKWKNYYAHRLIWEIHNGAIPPGMIVRHSCDNRRCINIAHLLIGTINDNVQDRVERGRSAIGGRQGLARMVVDTITGEVFGSVAEAAKKHGIKPSNLSAYLRGQNKNKTKLKYHA